MAKITQQLLLQAQEGQEVATAGILAHMMPVIRYRAAGGVCPGLDFDDAVQEGIIGLFHAIKSYSSAKGVSFESYASTCIQNAVISAQRAAGRKKHGPLNQSVPLEDVHQIPGPEELTIQNEQLQDTLNVIHTQLSELEQGVLELFLDGYSYEQIAQALNRTPKTVENALFRLRRKLKQNKNLLQ